LRNSIVRTCLSGLLVLGALSGCSKDSGTGPEANNKDTPPALPAVSTMQPALDFYGVPAPSVDQQSLTTGKPSDALQRSAGDHSNWINAYVRAVFIYLSAYDLLEEPVGAFAAAIHSKPQLQDDGSYLWTYIFVDGDIEYSVFLYGTRNEGTVEWRLEVSSNNPAQPLDHFVWFRGETNKDEKSGYWQFYQPAGETEGTETVRIDYMKTGRHEGWVKVTVNGSGLENEGDTLTFTDSGETGSIEYFDASAAFNSSIIWHRDGTGSLTVPDYNSGVTACWDEDQVNTECE
jgi:hypothetical protein